MRLAVAISALACLLSTHPFVAQSQAQVDISKSTADRGGVEILSDTHGIDLSKWLKEWHRETERNWKTPNPSEVIPLRPKKSIAAIRFKVMPNGRLKDGSMVLESRSGITAFDRAAWLAIIDSKYPSLPSDFHGPYIELRAYFVYGIESQQ
ncbi:hypothetical protein P8935_22720 [Telmatobacter sp. DSM 110680]|uniref:TonB C-terminal domain-containing protein n=1 Tax=Telmatobacter sp. DSM 110680 TaxID=3036704 RepID=A0AAU7DJ04_9BACT